MTPRSETRRTSPVIKLAMFAGLGLLGYLVGYVLAQFTDLPSGIAWDDGLAYVMGAVLLMLGVAVAVTMVFRPTALFADSGWLQVAVFVLAGLMFLAPMLAPGLIAPGLVFAGVVAAFLIQTVANVIVWRRSDEMMRRLMTETSTLAFWGLQGVFFLYAAAERMALIQPISAWGMAGILMAVYLAASIVPSVRRGLT